MKRLFVGNLPRDTQERDLEELFSQHGRVRGVEVASDVFSGECKGFGFVEMEGHEARAAMAALDGSDYKGNRLRVNEEKPRPGGKKKGRGRR